MENRKKLLFANKQKFTNEMFDQLSEIVDVMFLDGPETDNYDSLDFSDIDGVVCFNFFKHNDINRFPKLDYIHTTSTGYDQFDLKDLKDRGITLKNCPGVHSIPISEFVIGSILQIYKKFDKLKKLNSKSILERADSICFDFSGILKSALLGSMSFKFFILWQQW